MSNEAEILSIIKTAYEKEEETKTLREKIAEVMFSSEFYYIFMDEAFEALEENKEPVESLISRWALTFCLHGEMMDKDSIYTMQIVLWREVLYNVLATMDDENYDDEEYYDEDEDD